MYDKIRVLIINKDVRKLLARMNGNENTIWIWNDSPVYRDLSDTGSMYGRRKTSGRTGVMMVVGSVRYIPMHMVGEGDGEGKGGGKGGWHGYGGGR